MMVMMCWPTQGNAADENLVRVR